LSFVSQSLLSFHSFGYGLTWQYHFDNDPNVLKSFAKLRFLVLDEADRLLEKAFEDEMVVLLGELMVPFYWSSDTHTRV
jgi:hypothetical protein